MDSTAKAPDKKKSSHNRSTTFWLVIFLGPGEWFSNPKKNKKKLIIGLPIVIASFVATMILIISAYSNLNLTIESSTLGSEDDQYSSRMFYAMMASTGMIAVYIWALIDVFSRSKSWYEDYPD